MPQSSDFVAEPLTAPESVLCLVPTLNTSLNQQLQAFCLARSQGKYLPEMIQHHLSGGGKQLRVSLILALSKTLDLAESDVMAWAMACEMLHNGSLIHDDLQDRDRMRRGQASVWAHFGAAHAINAGNFFLLGGLQWLDASHWSPQTQAQLCLRYSRMATDIVTGQSLEFELLERLVLSEPLWTAYLKCIHYKTASLFAHGAAGVGSILLAHFPQIESSIVDLLFAIFAHLGRVFQIQDDILDLYGDKGRENPGCDIREGKVSALIVSLLEQRPALRSEVAQLLQKPYAETTSADIDQISTYFAEADVLPDLMQRINQEFQAMTVLLQQLPYQGLTLRHWIDQIAHQLLHPISHLAEYQQIEVPSCHMP